MLSLTLFELLKREKSRQCGETPRGEAQRGETQRGATLVEFALAAVIILGMVGFFFEGGVAYFRYSLLVNSLTHNARRLALDMRGESCGDPAALKLRAETEVKNFLSTAYGAATDDVAVQASIAFTPASAPQPNKCTLKLRARWPAYCFFCIFFQQGLAIGAEGESLIEDQCFTCSGGC